MINIQVKGNGPIGQIVAEANAEGEVRGYVQNPHVHLPSNSLGKLDVAGAVGTEGFIHVIKDLGLKEPYRGSVPIVSGELGDDFTYYFAVSEQTNSAVGLGVLVEADNSVKVAGGFIIQLLPGLSDEEITEIEKLKFDPFGHGTAGSGNGTGGNAAPNFAGYGSAGRNGDHV